MAQTLYLLKTILNQGNRSRLKNLCNSNVTEKRKQENVCYIVTNQVNPFVTLFLMLLIAKNRFLLHIYIKNIITQKSMFSCNIVTYILLLSVFCYISVTFRNFYVTFRQSAGSV